MEYLIFINEIQTKVTGRGTAIRGEGITHNIYIHFFHDSFCWREFSVFFYGQKRVTWASRIFHYFSVSTITPSDTAHTRARSRACELNKFNFRVYDTLLFGVFIVVGPKWARRSQDRRRTGPRRPHIGGLLILLLGPRLIAPSHPVAELKILC